MWEWIKGKSGNERLPKARDVKFVPQVDTNSLGVALDDVIELSLYKSARASLLYARAAGYLLDVIDYSNSERLEQFTSCLRKPFESLLSEDIVKAAEWFEKELEFMLKSEFWETFLIPIAAGVSFEEKRTSIALLQKALTRSDFRSLCRSIDRDVGREAVEESARMKERDLTSIFELILEKKAVLFPIFQRALVAGKNKYGEQEYVGFFSEVSDFFEHFFPEGSLSFYFSVKPYAEVGEFVLSRLSALPSMDRIPVDGVEFEFWCAQQLERQGWSATVTKSSGDQGVDIEVMRDGFRVVVQCKRYSQPIGNKAVQEVFTGRKHRLADAAAIIGTGGFTRSAIELANSTDVELFGAEEIEAFSNKFGFSSEYDGAAIANEDINISFTKGGELILGKTFLIVAEKHLPFLTLDDTDIDASALSGKILSSIDAATGAGAFSLSPSELVSMMLFSEITLIALVQVASADADYKTIERDGSSLIYNEKVALDDDVSAKIRASNDPVPFYSLFSGSDVSELRALMLSLYQRLPSIHREALENIAPHRPFSDG